MKQLLIEAYESEKLRLVITFVCRMIKEAKNSTIFKTTNHWMLSIFKLLKEFYTIYEKERVKNDIY